MNFINVEFNLTNCPGEIKEFDILTGQLLQSKTACTIFPASHFVTSDEKLQQATRSTVEMENVTGNILGDLGTQTEQMKGVNNKIGSMNDDIDSSSGYPFYQNSFKRLFPVFKNKKTGKEFTSERPLEVISEGDGGDWISDIVNGNYCFRFNGVKVYDKDKKVTSSIFNITSFDYENMWYGPIDVLDFEADDDDKDYEEAEWEDFEFVRFDESY